MDVSLNIEILVECDRPGIRWNDSLLAAIAFRVDEAFLDEVHDGT